MIPAAGRTVGLLCGLAVLLALLLTSCLPPQASYRLGFGTNEVNGVLDLPPPDPGAGPPLIVVFLYHSLLTGFSGEPGITRQTVTVPTIGRYGQFTIPMPQDVVRMEIIFAAPERLTDTFRFDRQLGVGTVTYKATLPVMPNWRSHFYTYLEPQFEHLIVDTRYQLSPRDSQRLADWLNDQKQRLEANAAARQVNPTPAQQAAQPAVPRQ